MRASLRTLALVFVSAIWGAALYAALLPDRQYDEAYMAALVEEVEVRTLAKWRLEAGELLAESSPGGEARRRHLNNARADASPQHHPPLPLPAAVPVAAKEDSNAVWRAKDGEALPAGPRVLGVDFSIRKPFHFPMPHYSRSREELLASPWVTQLQAFLGGVTGSQISLVTASIEHQDVLLNWLISANLVASPPLANTLVLTLDRAVYDLVAARNISTLYVSEDMVISPTANVTRRFSQVHVVRLTVLRLINHYGFSVVNYDCDAILLKNPQPIFDGHKDADLIGTFGKGPGQLYVKWGITLNTGVMLVRSNEKIEYYWELMSREMSRDHSSTDDQANINLALERMNVRWLNFDKTKNIDHLERAVYGLADHDIIVMLLPENKVCRYVCDPGQREEYFVWHTFAIKENRTVTNKMTQAKVGNAWFLQSDWLDASEGAGPHMTSLEWLRHIADPNLIR